MSSKHPQVYDTALALVPGGQCIQAIRRAAGMFVFSSGFAVVLRDGISVIKVIGNLYRGLFGDDYADLRATLDAAIADPRVKAILLDVDSPGGTVTGLFDLTDYIYSLRGVKPLWALAGDLATSASYAIASATEQVWATPTALVGSIGVIALHMDQSGFNEREGFKISEVVSGARKAEFSPHRPLSKDALGLLQDVVDDAAEMFFAAVSRHRGLAVEAIRAQQAQIFRAPDALAAGLVDHVGSRAVVLAELARSLQKQAAVQEAQAQAEAERQSFARVWKAAEPAGLSADQTLDLIEAFGSDAALERVLRLGPGALISDASLARWHGTGDTDRRRGAVR
jgi:signal peptide peptidase SppA